MADESPFFIYVVPLVGVVLVAIGIGAAVTGGYAILEAQSGACGAPTISVTSPGESARYADPDLDLPSVDFEALSPAERVAFREALADPVGEARIEGTAPNRALLTNGTLVRYQGEAYYVTVVAENTCFTAPPLQFPLGLLALGLGVVALLTPPAYRKLVALETEVGWRVTSDDED